MTLDDLRSRATITVEEAALVLGISRGVAYQAARRGEIPALRLGERWVIPAPRLLEMLGVAHADERRTPGHEQAEQVRSA